MARKNISDKDVVCAVSLARDSGFTWRPIDILKEKTGEPWKVCLRAIERAFERGFLDYGVSIEVPWVTEEGKIFLQSE